MKRKSIIQGFSICAALIFVILTSGCAVGPTIRTYSGDKLQKSEVAVIKGWWLFALLGYGGFDIYSIDDTVLEATKVEASPGRHELVIRSYSFSFVAPVGAPPESAQVAFNFEAGHEYKIKYKGIGTPGFKQDGIIIVDVTTGDIILTLHFSPRTSYSSIGFGADIRPPPENHGNWNKEEVDTVVHAIATVAKRHGLKKTWNLQEGFTLSGKGFALSLNAYFESDPFKSLIPITESSSPFQYLGLWKIKIRKPKGTIRLRIELGSYSLTDSQRLLVKNMWLEVLDPLRNNFGERIGGDEIYKPDL